MKSSRVISTHKRKWIQTKEIASSRRNDNSIQTLSSRGPITFSFKLWIKTRGHAVADMEETTPSSTFTFQPDCNRFIFPQSPNALIITFHFHTSSGADTSFHFEHTLHFDASLRSDTSSHCHSSFYFDASSYLSLWRQAKMGCLPPRRQSSSKCDRRSWPLIDDSIAEFAILELSNLLNSFDEEIIDIASLHFSSMFVHFLDILSLHLTDTPSVIDSWVCVHKGGEWVDRESAQSLCRSRHRGDDISCSADIALRLTSNEIFK